LRSIWCQPTALYQYYPLTGTTFGWIIISGVLDIALPRGNLLLHILAALLFWGLLRRLQVSGAWLAGAIFALHPVMVESVAWITERKNVLSMVLYLGALLAYLRYARGWRVASRQHKCPNDRNRLHPVSIHVPVSEDPLVGTKTGHPSPLLRVGFYFCLLLRYWQRLQRFRCRRSFS